MTTENKSLDQMLDEIRADIAALKTRDDASFSDITTTLDAIQVRLDLLEKADMARAEAAPVLPVSANTAEISGAEAEWLRHILGKYFFDDRPADVNAIG